MKKLLAAFMISGLYVTAAWAAPTLTLLPGNSLFGAPGSTVGWGFTLTDTTDYVVLDSTIFTFNPGSGGTYTDYISLSASIFEAGPTDAFGASPSITRLFSSTSQTGLGAFHLNSSDPLGASFTGTLTVNYSTFSGDVNDPNFNPDTESRVTGGIFTQAVSVGAVPEPASLPLLGGAFLAAVIARRSLFKVLV